MKKFFYMISTVAFMASFASCNKMEQGNTPAEAPSIDGTTTITVSATVPQTKTYLKEGKTFWTSGDIVTLMGRDEASVVATATASAEATQETNNFTFEKWPVAATPEFLVFDGPLAYNEENYAGNKVMAPVLNEDGTITAEVRKHQEIVNKSNFSKYANLSIGKLEGESSLYIAEMKNVCGLIKVKTTKEDPLEYIKIENLGESYITGVVKVDYNNGEPRVVEVLNGSKEVKLTSHITNTDDKLPAGVFYACVIPGTYTPKVIMKPVGGAEVAITAKSPVTIERNKIMDFGEIDNITPESGSGEGEEGGDDSVDPKESIDITLDFSTWPFDETTYPTSATLSDEQGDTYTYLGLYKFVIKNSQAGTNGSKDGYYYRSASSCLQGNTDESRDFVLTLPDIAGYELKSIGVYVVNAETNKKTIRILDSDKNQIGSFSAYKELGLYTQTLQTSARYLSCEGKNVQIGKLVLTYTK